MAADYDEKQELTRYIWRWHADLLTDFERRAGQAIHGRAKAKATDSPKMKKLLLKRIGHIGDPEVETALTNGHEQFRWRVTQRILHDHANEVEVHRCPKCNSVLASPKAKQCLWCKHKWHRSEGI